MHSQGLAPSPPPSPPPSRHGPSLPFPFPLFVSPPCWQLDWCCVVGSFCQGRGVHSAHSSCCSVTVRVFGGCSNGCCVFFACSPVPCCCLLCQAAPHRFVCIGSSGLTSWCWVFTSACVFPAVDTMPSYACSGSGCDLLCGRWKVRGSCRTCQAVMARTVRTWVMCC